MDSGKQGLTRDYVRELLGGRDPEEVAEQLLPHGGDAPRSFWPSASTDPSRVERLWKRLGATSNPALWDSWTQANAGAFAGNIENFIGTTKIPTGIAGPLRVNGLHAQGEYPIPLATSEAALVASYHRGICLLNAAGGCSAMVVYESVARAPAFLFDTIGDAGRFLVWVTEQLEALKRVAGTTTSHGELRDVAVTVEGNHVYLSLEFFTGDASGQNMVTIAAEAVCAFIDQESPVPIRAMYVEGNLSGDKKASAKAFTDTRGKKVTAEAVLPSALVEKFLHCSAQAMTEYWRVSAVGGVLSGTLGVQGHFANGLAAFYLATGQDVACVAESAVGVTRFELTEGGDLYASVTLPALMIGSVGGGTGLPSQRAALELLGLSGTGKARALAEVCCGTLLGGELSIIGALAAGEFTRAHQKLARKHS
ncbi:MAG: hydroxymethylglutaryl-CoA reductase [Verrucomicrobiota bacterium]